jgi:hypothetical protein
MRLPLGALRRDGPFQLHVPRLVAIIDLMTITQAWVEEERRHRYRRSFELRVQTVQAARTFVEEVGFCHFWPIQGVEMPNLFHAIAGRIRSVPNEHDDPDIGKCWGWKDDALDKRWWYYGKLIRRRATLVSLDVLPLFYACSSNYGDYTTDHLEEYRDGRLSAEAKAIYEALLENGPLHTVDLRKKAHMANDSAKYRFEKALTELQAGLKVLPVGVAAAGAWHYAFIYDIVPRWYPDLPPRARPVTRREAQKALVLRHLQNVAAATRDEVFRTLDVLGWTPEEFGQAVGALIENGVICEVPVDGYTGKYLVPRGTLDAEG